MGITGQWSRHSFRSTQSISLQLHNSQLVENCRYHGTTLWGQRSDSLCVEGHW